MPSTWRNSPACRGKLRRPTRWYEAGVDICTRLEVTLHAIAAVRVAWVVLDCIHVRLLVDDRFDAPRLESLDQLPHDGGVHQLLVLPLVQLVIVVRRHRVVDVGG